MPGDPGATVVTNARAYYHYTRGYGCNGHPAFPTPFVGRKVQHNSGASRRGIAEVYLAVIASQRVARMRAPLARNDDLNSTLPLGRLKIESANP
jgi:hypothetical protein